MLSFAPAKWLMSETPYAMPKANNRFSHAESLIPLDPDAVEVPRETVEHAAELLGPDSASADALKRADEYEGRVRFWYSPSYGTLSLELMKDKGH